jgi:hypothetical protein
MKKKKYLLIFMVIILVITTVGCDKHVHVFDTFDDAKEASYWDSGTDYYRCKCGLRTTFRTLPLLSTAAGISQIFNTNNGNSGSVEVQNHIIGTEEINTAVLKTNSLNETDNFNYGPSIDLSIDNNFFTNNKLDQTISNFFDFSLMTNNSYFGVNYTITNLLNNEKCDFVFYYFFFKGIEPSSKPRIVLIEGIDLYISSSLLRESLILGEDPSYDFDKLKNEFRNIDVITLMGDKLIGLGLDGYVKMYHNEYDTGRINFNITSETPLSDSSSNDPRIHSLTFISPNLGFSFDEKVRAFYLSKILFFNISDIVPLRYLKGHHY